MEQNDPRDELISELIEALELALGARCGLAWDDCPHRCREKVQSVLDKARGKDHVTA